MNARAAGGALRAPPDERHGETNGRVQTSHLEAGVLGGGERPRKDRGGEAACGERSHKERVPALESEVKLLARVGE